MVLATGDAFDEVALRKALLAEEFSETMQALDMLSIEIDHDIQRELIVKVADGLADLIYVEIGTALQLGIPLDRVWAEVHLSNMAKVADGVRLREDGKILKPEGWEPPDVEKAVF